MRLLAALLLVGLLAPLAHAQSTQPDLRVGPMSVELMPGAKFHGEVTLTNPRDTTEHVRLVPRSPGLVLDVASGATLDPRGTIRLPFSVAVPGDHGPGQVMIEFYAWIGPDVMPPPTSASKVYLPVRITRDAPLAPGEAGDGIVPFADLASIGASITDGATYEGRVKVLNPTNQTRTFPVTITAPPGWEPTVTPDTLTLGPLMTTILEVRATPGPNAENGTGGIRIGDPRAHTFVQLSLNVTHENRTRPPIAEARLRLTVDPSAVTLEPGGQVAVTVNVSNEGDAPWTGDIGSIASPGLRASSMNLTLGPGKSMEGTASIAASADLRPGRYSLVFFASDTVRAEVRVDVAFALPVAEPPNGSAAVAALEIAIDPGLLRITNDSTRTVRVTLTNLNGVAVTGTMTHTLSGHGGLGVGWPQGRDYVVPPHASIALDLAITALAPAPHAATVEVLNGDGKNAILNVEIVNALPLDGQAAVIAPDAGAGVGLAATAAMGAAGVGAGAGAVLVAQRRWPLVAAGLYARLSPARLWEHPVRARIQRAVTRTPGIAVNELGREVGLAPGVLYHHTQKLESAGLLVSVPDANRRRFYPPGTPRPGARNPLHERVLAALENGEQDASHLARELGVSRQALHYHLRRLAREGAIVAQRRGRTLILSRQLA